MQSFTFNLWLGVWLVLVAFLGVPALWKEYLFILTGLWLIVMALIKRRGYTPAGNGKEDTASASETSSVSENSEHTG
ncbi:MAG: hypothetical protein Q7R88_02770 [bacterium]|nr:hypothetical protein [bacterium]